MMIIIFEVAHMLEALSTTEIDAKKLMANLPKMETTLVLGIPPELVLFGFVLVLFCFPMLRVLECS